MFRELGIKLDNFIEETTYNIRKWNQKRFWFKFYTYLWASKQISKRDTNPLVIINNLHEWKCLYDWQAKRLITKFARWNIK